MALEQRLLDNLIEREREEEDYQEETENVRLITFAFD